MDRLLWTTAGAAWVLLLPVLNVVPYRLIAELDAAPDRLGVDLAGLDLCQNRLGTLQKRLFDILASLSTRFEENQVVLLSKVAGLQECHLPGFFEIFFVADEDDDDVRAGEGSCVVEPVRERVEGFTWSCVVNEESTSSAAVVAARDWAESLLAGSLKVEFSLFSST